MADRRPFHEKYADIAKRWNISKDIVNYIIRNYEKKLEEELKKLDKVKIKLPKFFPDNRKPEEYIYDVFDGWLIEDIICDAWLFARLRRVDENIEVIHMGTNRDRKFEKFNPRNITTKPDFAYRTSTGKEIKIELQMSRENRDAIGYDMKESKVNRAKKENILFLWVILSDDTYFFIDPKRDLVDVEPISNPSWGGKLVYRLGPEKIDKIGRYHMKEEIPESYYKILGLQ